MTVLRLILADQLSASISSLHGVDKAQDTVMLCEVMEEARYVPHHPKKIAFLFSAMRHFAAELEESGVRVRYIKLDDASNTGSFTGEVQRAAKELNPSRLIVTEPGEYRVLDMMKGWHEKLGIPVEIVSDTRFLATHAEFDAWAQGKKQFRMEFFYREMRRKYAVLMEPDGKPSGGVWNYDKQNRKPPKVGMTSPPRLSHKKSAITQDVLALVKDTFSHHFGTLEPFFYAVTRKQALMELDHFVTHILPNFGDYQDAMVAGEPYLYHSLLSSYLNAGLLLPLEICQKAEAAYRASKAPLNAVEGFIRQILGWREYIRGIYWHFMPEYGERNTLNAAHPLPDFYWGATTHMFCVAESVRHTRDHAYSHHIQRLMITGNFALLAGLDVKAVQAWYLAVYSDAYEWAEMPNTLGMALFGDGGVVASKPYAASGKYIHRMSNYCETCTFDPDEMTGEKACPFNALYWDFLVRHEQKFRRNQRMPYVFSTWDKFTPEKQKAIRAQAALSLQKMADGIL
ncbi:MAG: cryptochrome/photolyase family protein [Holosporales bacterium]|jgi:deoxyribodipyrimidine photolyase-related protein